MAYTLYIKHAKGNDCFLVTDNRSTIYGVADTVKGALDDYWQDVQEFIALCDQEYDSMGYGLQEQCNRLRASAAPPSSAPSGEEG